MIEPFRLPMAAVDLIPHRRPMQLVETLLEADEAGGVVAAEVTDGPLTGPAGGLDEVGVVELLAQGYAAVQGYLDRRAGRPVQMGFLVGIKRAEIYRAPRLGDRLLVRVRPSAVVESFAIVDGEVWRGDELLASANFKLWISPGDEAAG